MVALRGPGRLARFFGATLAAMRAALALPSSNASTQTACVACTDWDTGSTSGVAATHAENSRVLHSYPSQVFSMRQQIDTQ